MSTLSIAEFFNGAIVTKKGQSVKFVVHQWRPEMGADELDEAPPRRYAAVEL
jgi:hypothetical protein